MLLKKTLILSILFFATSAYAVVVFDPSNFVKNTITATSALQAEAQRAEQIINQIRQYETMVKQLKNLDSSAISYVTGISQQSIDNIKEYKTEIDKLTSAMQSLKSHMDDRLTEQALGNLSWDQYINRELDFAQQQFQSAQQAFASEARLIKKIENDYAALQKLQPLIPETEGTHQDLQLLNAQMNKVLEQNSTLMAYTANRGIEEHSTKASTLAKRKRSLEQAQAIKKRLKENDQESGDLAQRYRTYTDRTLDPSILSPKK